jgi:hypothetical protein
VAGRVDLYHRSAGGKVTYIDALTLDEAAAAISRAPHEWSTSMRGFAAWPDGPIVGELVELQTAWGASGKLRART